MWGAVRFVLHCSLALFFVFLLDLTISLRLYPQIAMLQTLRALDPDRCAIVRWNSSFVDNSHICLEFELLSMSLLDLLDQVQVLNLDSIRTIQYSIRSVPSPAQDIII